MSVKITIWDLPKTEKEANRYNRVSVSGLIYVLNVFDICNALPPIPQCANM
jgi:hypothetical protein